MMTLVAVIVGAIEGRGFLNPGMRSKWIYDYIYSPNRVTTPLLRKTAQAIAKQLGIQFSKGVIVEPATQMLGINDPRFALAASYSSHAITQGFEVLTLFPMATGITTSAHDNWVAQPLLTSMERSWVETKPIDGKISYDAGSDTLGPVNIAVTLTRQLAGSEQKNPSAAREQRAVIVGDGDFLSNAYLGNGGNLDLGLNMINGLSHDDQFVAIPAKGALDRNLALSATAQVMLVAGLLVLIPGGLLVAGLVIWLKRRKG